MSQFKCYQERSLVPFGPLTGWIRPIILGRAICLTQFIDFHVDLIQKYPESCSTKYLDSLGPSQVDRKLTDTGKKAQLYVGIELLTGQGSHCSLRLNFGGVPSSAFTGWWLGC